MAFTDWQQDVAVYSITGQTRHLWGPDAVFLGGGGEVTPLMLGGEALGGKI